jgi:hypothetical protein
MGSFRALFNKLFGIINFVFGIGLVLSAVLKLISPGQIISTVKALALSLFRLPLSSSSALVSIFVLVIFEAGLGFTILFGVGKKAVLPITYFVVLAFTVISQYLFFQGRLESCGCFGVLTKLFYPFHLGGLYFLTVLFTLKFLLARENEA